MDVTAPGESVWCAGVNGDGAFTVGRGSGTSYAVATVAGVAALWLSFHGRGKLAARYGVEKIPVIFNQLLRDTCDPVPGWGEGFGRGLVDAARLLSAPLPGPSNPVPHAAALMRDHPSLDDGGLITFAHLFGGEMPRGRKARTAAAQAIKPRLAELLGVGEEEVSARLKEVGQELAFHFSSDPALRRQFAGGLAPKGMQARAAGGVDNVHASLMARGTAALKKRLAGVP